MQIQRCEVLLRASPSRSAELKISDVASREEHLLSAVLTRPGRRKGLVSPGHAHLGTNRFLVSASLSSFINEYSSSRAQGGTASE
jgi:hypothetical protein